MRSIEQIKQELPELFGNERDNNYYPSINLKEAWLLIEQAEHSEWLEKQREIDNDHFKEKLEQANKRIETFKQFTTDQVKELKEKQTDEKYYGDLKDAISGQIIAYQDMYRELCK